MLKNSMIALVLGSFVALTGCVAEGQNGEPGTDPSATEPATAAASLTEDRPDVSEREATVLDKSGAFGKVIHMESESTCVISAGGKYFCCTWVGSSLGPVCGPVGGKGSN